MQNTSIDIIGYCRWNSLSLGYTESMGLPALRAEIAARYSAPTTPEHILVAAPQEAVFLAMSALLSPGDDIVCMAPCYQSLYEVALAVGARVAFWRPRTSPQGHLTFAIPDLESLVCGRNIKLVVTNVPHNPTGWLPTPVEWRGVVEACRSGGAWLFSDEMYRGLELDPAARLQAGVDAYPERGISLGGLSKAVGLPGLRVGWLACRDVGLLRRAAHLRDFTTICGSAPSEILALMGLRAWDRIVERQLSIVRANLAALEAFAGRWRGVLAWAAPAAGTVAFPRFAVSPRFASVDEFCERLAEEYGVLLLPGSVYSFDGGGGITSTRARIGFGRRDLVGGLDRLEAAMTAMGLSPTP